MARRLLSAATIVALILTLVVWVLYYSVPAYDCGAECSDFQLMLADSVIPLTVVSLVLLLGATLIRLGTTLMRYRSRRTR